jgi:3-oxosteroid 1-dehydrogenase
VLERADKLGGVTALSMGEVWVAGNHLAAELGIEDSPDSGFRYLKRLSMDYGNDVATLNKVVHARVALKYFEDRIGLKMRVIRDCPIIITATATTACPKAGCSKSSRSRPKRSANGSPRHASARTSPYGFTHEDIFEFGGVPNMVKWDFARMGERLAKDERCLGPGLAAYFVKGALDRGIPIQTDTNVVGLIGDGERIVGVRAIQDGKDIFVKANKGVVIAVSSFERYQDYNKTLGQQLDLGSMVMSTIGRGQLSSGGSLRSADRPRSGRHFAWLQDPRRGG